MQAYIEERVFEVASYILDNRSTVRDTAKKFGISKSTVYTDVTERLQELNPLLAMDVREVLDLNKEERHIRGGEVTRLKHAKNE